MVWNNTSDSSVFKFPQILFLHVKKCPVFYPHILIGLDEAQCFPCVHHFLQAGSSGSPGFQAQVLALPDLRRGTKHQELQVPTLAKPFELQ